MTSDPKSQATEKQRDGENFVSSIDKPSVRQIIGAACITLAFDECKFISRPKMILMHPTPAPDPEDVEQRTHFCDAAQKEAAEVLFEVLMAACEGQPLLISKIEQALARRAASRVE